MKYAIYYKWAGASPDSADGWKRLSDCPVLESESDAVEKMKALEAEEKQTGENRLVYAVEQIR